MGVEAFTWLMPARVKFLNFKVSFKYKTVER